MKKSFPLHLSDKEDSRVVEAIKLTLTRYVKRERNKKLPEGVDFWFFHCKVGADAGSATATDLAGLPKALDTIAQASGAEVYVEIEAAPGYRVKKPAPVSYPQRRS